MVRFLQQNSGYYCHFPIHRGLKDAFESVDEETARHCFYNAFGYIAP